ncbi:M28 family peptidase [Paraglaciecola sp.]|uniref:M28 family peptidase n=1 Tax=Paraglaciecola sp. TaxID=1920173 RepID=UPI0030F4539B
MFSSINAEQLWHDFANLADETMQGRRTGTEGAHKAQSYIKSRFNNMGLEPFPQYPDYQQTFRYPDESASNKGVNVLGWHKGTTFPEQYIVLTAHYDHLGMQGKKVFYGADDNASGVAALLTLADALIQQASTYSVIFVATDAEELGLYGASAFLRSSPVNVKNFLLNINLDMLAEGSRRKKLYITSRGDATLDKKIQHIITQAGVCLVKGHRSRFANNSFQHNVNWRKASDHTAFAKLAIPYLFIGVETHARYHTPEDTVEQIDRLFYTAATETAWLMLQTFNQ